MLKQGRQTIGVRERDDQEELNEQLRFIRHGAVPSDLIRPLLRKYSAAKAEKGTGQNPPLFLLPLVVLQHLVVTDAAATCGRWAV
jgi:hypothetical protein